MKINVGIVGYGNLGKAVAKELKANSIFNLVAIFSKRDLTGTISYKKIKTYKDKISLLFLCGGSASELEGQAMKLIEHFNIIECYDNHSRLKTFESSLNSKAKKYNKIALCSLGWDPGLFSLMRGIFDGLGFTPYTFWGKGLSQGHTQAIKNISGVVDAVQFTIPNNKIKHQINNGRPPENKKSFHKRQCFVVCKKENQKTIKKQIVEMPDYFKGYKTKVSFVSQSKLNKIKTFSHKGEVMTKNNILNFSLNLPSNPVFTAKVMMCFARAIIFLVQEKNFGAHTIFDLPIKYILSKNQYEYL